MIHQHSVADRTVKRLQKVAKGYASSNDKEFLRVVDSQIYTKRNWFSEKVSAQSHTLRKNSSFDILIPKNMLCVLCLLFN